MVNPAAHDKLAIGITAATAAIAAGLIFAALWAGRDRGPMIDPANAQQVAHGQQIYQQHCAACHGSRLEGQPQWRVRQSNGRLPAPPHDASGHTWHHPDTVLFGITKHGLVPGRYAPPGYHSDMPAFGTALSDAEIHAVIAYIKAQWPKEIRQMQRELSAKNPGP